MVKASTLAYILHAKPYKETSLILNLFSQSRGRFSVLAKGVKRKAFQAQKAILQPFNLINIEYSGKSQLKTLCNAELLLIRPAITNRALACGFYINELVIRSLKEGHEFESLFSVYSETIQLLKESLPLAPLLRDFEVQLLMELGIAPSWEVDIQGEPISNDAYYHFIPEQGFKLVSKKLASNRSDSNNVGFIGDAILGLNNSVYKPKTIKVCQQITQLLLRPVIGYQPFESRKFWL